MARYDVFISYCREEETLARSLAESLKRKGYRIFIDDELVGENYPEKIYAAIDASKNFVLVLTLGARRKLLADWGDQNRDWNRNWMQKELLKAVESKKCLAIFRDPTCPRFTGEDDLPQGVKQAVLDCSYVKYDGQLWDACVKKLCKALKGIPWLWRRVIAIVAALVLVLFVVVGSVLASYTVIVPPFCEPTIELTDVPAYGDNQPVLGKVICEDGSKVDPASWHVAMFLQLQDGGTLYPKPSYAKPYVELDEDGTLQADFVTGGNDSQSEVLHLLLVPSSYSSGSFDDALKSAVDYVRVDRSEDGSVTWSRPDREMS